MVGRVEEDLAVDGQGEERRDVFVYDPAADSWSEGPELPIPNHAFDAVAVDGEIWMIGGRSEDEILRDVWILNTETGRWRPGRKDRAAE